MAERKSSPPVHETPLDLAALAAEPPCTQSALRRAARQLGNLYDEAVASSGLKATQIRLLAQIASLAGDEGPTLQALAEEQAVQISALTHALRPLLRDGLVALTPDARDRRAKHARLTPAGRRSLSEGLRLWAVANRRVESLLGPASAAALRDLAERVSSKAFLEAFRADR